MNHEAALLDVRNLSKSYLGVKALESVSFDLKRGEVHALLGENGAGKSTFMQILMGLLQPDEGQIFFEGTEISDVGVNQKLNLGISMIHQEILDVPELTVAENIYLGREAKSGFWLKKSDTKVKATELLRHLGLDIPVNVKNKDLSIAQKQMVEIAKAVSMNAKVIIMDEPTSALNDAEVSILFKIIRDLSSKGVAIIYISHKMNEIHQIADRITVLRDGKKITTERAKDLSISDIIKLMVGREVDVIFNNESSTSGAEVLRVKNLTRKGIFSNINFEIKAGEVFGIAGLMGAGRTEIARAIYGLDKYDSGQLWIEGQQVKIESPKEAIQKGIAYVSEDRKASGIIPDLSIIANVSLSALKKVASYNFVKSEDEKIAVAELSDQLKVKASNLNQKVIFLSGGNQQKVIIAKVLMTDPKLIILDEPTKGIDIGAKFEIYKLIKMLTDKGLAIILISSEMSEIIGLSDRVLVLSQGEQKVVLDRSEVTQEEIMKYAVH